MRMLFRSGRLAPAGFIAGALLLASCASPSAPAGEDKLTTSTKPYGSLTVGWSNSIALLDPAVSTALPGVGTGVFDSLVNITPDTKDAPGIAERWEIAPDGMSHTFYIRKGVKFHSGDDLTGADVKFSIERILAPDATNADAPNWRGVMAGVDLKDDYTVLIRFKTPQFGLIKSLDAVTGGTGSVVPKKYIEEKGADYFRKNPVGSGPWKVAKLVLGERVELEAVDSHWRKVPQFKNLTILTIPDESTKVAMLKTGELDMADIGPDSAAGLKAAGLRIVSWDGGQQAVYSLMFDAKNPTQYAYGDVKVRKAMSLALNRKELADTLLRGYAEPGIVNRVLRTADFFDANQLKPDPYDPEGAKKLLAEAGYANGFNTKIWDQGGGGILSSFAQALGGYWRKIGVNATLAPVDSSTIISLISPAPKPDVWNTVYLSGLGPTVASGPIRFDILSSFHSTKGFFKNHTNKRLDELLDRYPTLKDPDERKRIALEATVLAKNEYSAVSVLIVSTNWALGPKTGGMTPIQGFAQMGPIYETVTHAR